MADTHDGLWRSVATEGWPRSACASIVERLLSLPEFRSIHRTNPEHLAGNRITTASELWTVTLALAGWQRIIREAATLDDAAALALAALDAQIRSAGAE